MAKASKNKRDTRKYLVSTREWQESHPSGVVCESDIYYSRLATRIANEIGPVICEIDGMTDEDIKALAIELAAYLEDKVSGINLWNAFIGLYREKFHREYPFYDIEGEEMFADEPNMPDVRFIVWNAINRSMDTMILNPLNDVTEQLAADMFDILVEEFETAPESQELVDALYTPANYADMLYLRGVCGWISARAYLTAAVDFENAFEAIYKVINTCFGDDIPERACFYAIETYAYMNVTVGPLALCPCQWLGKMMELSEDPEIKALAPKVKDIESLTLLPYEIKSVSADGFDVRSVVDTIIHVSFDTLPDGMAEQVKAGNVMIASLFRYDGIWHINGLATFSSSPNGIDDSVKKYKEKKENEVRSRNFQIDRNGGSPIGVAADWNEISRRFDFDKAKQSSENLVKDDKDFLYFINSDGAMTILPDCAGLVDISGNPFYSPEKSTKEGAALLLRDDASMELCEYLVDNNLLPDARLVGPGFPNDEARRWFAQNSLFLSKMYHTEIAQFKFPKVD